MTDYDTMSVRELVREIAREENLASDIGVTGDNWISLKEFESALRKAAIREASVGLAIISIVQNRRRIHAPTLRELPDGDYNLIPEEKP